MIALLDAAPGAVEEDSTLTERDLVTFAAGPGRPSVTDSLNRGIAWRRP